MERGGAFLGDVLAHGDQGISSILTRVPKTPDSSGKLRFDPESLKGLIREQVADGKTSFALVDAYMGGRFAAQLRDNVLVPLVREHGLGQLKFQQVWLRETFGFELGSSGVGEGIVLRSLQGTIKPNSPYAQDIQNIYLPTRVVLGDDMDMIFDPNSQKPLQIFNSQGDVVRTVNPNSGENSRDVLIRLINETSSPNEMREGE
jgi:hypothetical protein